MKKIDIEIPVEFFDGIGANTLLGVVLRIMQKENYSMTEKAHVHLVFIQTTTKYREKNNGPMLSIFAEYAFPCFLADVLWLQNNGYTVTMEEKLTRSS
jgi:hypothetical protein